MLTEDRENLKNHIYSYNYSPYIVNMRLFGIIHPYKCSISTHQGPETHIPILTTIPDTHEAYFISQNALC